MTGSERTDGRRTPVPTQRFARAAQAATTPATERRAILADPGFGRHFTDHMARARWSPEEGWHGAEVCGLRPYELHPGTAVLHYAQEIFEGLKAYRQPDGGVALFRPELNAARFVRSARRLALPELPPELFVESVAELVRADAAWVPDPATDASLYLRPYMFAAEAFLGVRPAQNVEYGVVASPAGPYFSAGSAGITLWIDREHTRAARGGTGSAKCGGNYAASLLPQALAKQHGCDQVLHTIDVSGETFVDESGTMNLFIVTRDAELVTPSLGTILPGVTRDTVLALAEAHQLQAVERPVPLEELVGRIDDGTIVEVFASGTAAVITSVTALRGPGTRVAVASGKPGRRTAELRRHITDLQFGRRPDDRGWSYPVLDRLGADSGEPS
ncbi:branched-chain amino acid aminotransferase [Microlunatus flavus]|uniref:Branched-chain-amino-acid aminotransferase n=1 Tax=Microlunatus flavus TaxID=1036181 RepID=A0A1H9JJ22_9ACTN|nr:branched-chain amino acid aminotransferase [Microlunatus flavus]SEQ86820.1 branched-chain amino acid aminotransferase [Microlunatus flavus]